MTESDLAQQIQARKKLLWVAERAKNGGISMSEFEEDPQAIEFCVKNGLNPSILTHISWFVWKAMR